MGRKHKQPVVLNIILSFILSVFITIICYTIGINFGLLGESTIIKALDTSDYYQKVMDYSTNQAKALAIPAGIDQSVMDDVFVMEETSAQCRNIIEASFKGNVYETDVHLMRKTLSDNINRYITNKGLSSEDVSEENVNLFIDLVASRYSDNLKIPYINYVADLSSQLHQIMIFLIPVLAVLSLFDIFVILKINKWVHRGLRYIAYSFLAATVMTAVFPMVIYIKKPYAQLNLDPEYFRNFLVYYIDESLRTFMAVSLFMAAVSALVIYVVSVKRKDVVR